MAKFNSSNPAVKRIMQEMKEIHEHSSDDFLAEALEDDIFEWHFVVRGPPDSEFEDFPKEERRKIAEKSREDVPKFGGPARQQLINEMHQRMLQTRASSSASRCSATDDSNDAAGVGPRTTGGQSGATTAPAAQPEPEQPTVQVAGTLIQQRAAVRATSDTALNLLAFVLIVAILAILAKKVVFMWAPPAAEL